MKQATGKTNGSESGKKVSIQLKLGGHSFSLDTLPSAVAEATGEVEFVVLTPKTTLVPQEEFEPAKAADYLRLTGAACTAQEVAVWSSTEEPIVAVMAADAACIAAINERFGTRARFTTPLLNLTSCTTPTVWLYRTEGVLYIKVYDSALRFAEAVAAQTEADVIYYIERLSDEFLFSSFTASVAGGNCKQTVKALRNYFPRVECE